MGSRICMNTSCRVKATVQWKKGWELKSGQTADLCNDCGSAYENSVYCDTFHAEETGWRECSLCNKRLHCGCSASLPFLEIQDFGGVWCIKCAHSSVSHSVQARRDGITFEAQNLRKCSTSSDLQNTQISSKLDPGAAGDANLLSLGNIANSNVPRYLPQSLTDIKIESCGLVKPEANNSLGVVHLGFPNLSNAHKGPAVYGQPNEDNANPGVKDVQEPQIPSLSISLRSPAETSTFDLSFSSGGEEGDKSRSTPSQSGQRPRHILPKPPKSNHAKSSDANKSSFSPMRVGRPPAEGRLRNQLLPRYWPRITDQELQKLSGDLNSTIVPLFEKILSASDASRIGRLVLPKACAEAYFPPINQSEGLPLKIQDVKGNEWTFQFRFWPNNNSRMYVLEGVTPCIQCMQLQAGDTVTFSRIDPGGKLVIGYRKASNPVEMQDVQTSSAKDVQTSSANPSGTGSGENFCSDVTDGPPAVNGDCGVLPMKVDVDDHPSVLPEKSDVLNGDAISNKSEEQKNKANEEEAVQQPKLLSDKKRMRNISSKNKRLLMDSEDVIELRLTWEETQDLLRPPSSVKPNVITIEDFEFEEYSEPPVFGKRTFFTTQQSGVQEQWAQCDKCCKWRKLPSDVLLQPKWTCSENIWDSSRSSCSVPEEMSSKELDNVFRMSKDFKKRKVAENVELGGGCEPSGLDALATAAALGDHEEPSASATTRHPRHRPGCSCIVCIQPPSGKGKHKPSCVCNVCMTVKRRFKTLMMRKKKRKCDRETETAQQKSRDRPIKGLRLMKNAPSNDVMLDRDCVENDPTEENFQLEEGESSSKGHIDLNYHPIREEDVRARAQSSTAPVSAQAAIDPKNMYMKPNELTNCPDKPRTDSVSFSRQQPNGHGDRPVLSEECHASGVKADQHNADDGCSKGSL